MSDQTLLPRFLRAHSGYALSLICLRGLAAFALVASWAGALGQNNFRSRYHSAAVFDPRAGEYFDHTRIDEASSWKQIDDSFTPLHYGTFGGWISRVVWCVLGAAPGFLAISGSIVWLKRR